MLNILLKVFYIVVNTNATICQQFLKVHEFHPGNLTGTAEGNSLSLKQRNSNLPEPVALVKGSSLAELDSQKFYLDPGLDLGRQG
jgi:hypothetical protein